MPTPFMHLQVAEDVRTSPSLPSALYRRISQSWPAFYFGNVAPDYQSVCHIPREDTHFYTLPPDRKLQPYERMWRRYPQLINSDLLSAQQAAFIAGYAAHLMLDIAWFDEVVVPLFVRSDRWANHDDRRIVHFILLTYLDQMAFKALPASAGQTLDEASVHHWLPFAADDDLRTWQALLVEQLQPDGMLQTVEIYAKRLGLTPVSFRARLHDSDWMKRELFMKVPVDQVQQLMSRAVDDTIALLDRYYFHEVGVNDR